MNQTYRTLKFSVALTFAILLVSQAQAQLTVTHLWEADWTVFDSEHNEMTGSDQGVNQGGGTNEFSVGDLPDVISFMNGFSNLSVDSTSGSIRSSTNLHTRLNGESDFAFGDSHFQSVNDVQLLDNLVIAEDSGFIEIRVVVDGSFQHDLFVGSGPIGLSTLEANSTAGAFLFFGDEQARDTQFIDNTINGGLVDSSELHDFENVEMDFSLIFPFTDGESQDFFFQYNESATLDQFDLDAGFAEGIINNRFGHTLTMYGQVFDEEMNLLEGVTVGSSNGFTYQSFPSVPEPGCIGLLSMLGLLTIHRRKRIAYNANRLSRQSQ